ncbi:MAG: PorT family protein [Chitinophagaceae bacterium]|nr:PorT family protein [Chitinophagaceae bacterium]
MKKLLVISSLLLCIYSLKAQDATGGGPRFGIAVGGNANMWTGDDKDFLGVDPETRISWNAALLAHFPFGTMWAFQPELTLSNKGPKFSEGGEEVKFSANYLTLPLMLQYVSGGFYAEVGPELGVLLSAKLKDGDEVDVKDSFNSFEFAGNLGLGYRLASGFGVGARYNFGFSQLPDDDQGNDVSVKNSVFQLRLMYMLGGSKK